MQYIVFDKQLTNSWAHISFNDYHCYYKNPFLITMLILCTVTHVINQINCKKIKYFRSDANFWSNHTFCIHH